MYFIFFQEFDDITHFSANTMEKINIFMYKHNIAKDDVYLLKGKMISGIGNKHWPKSGNLEWLL